MKICLTLLLFVLSAVPAAAQLACADPCVVEQGKPIGFTVEPPPSGVPNGYRLYVDGDVFIDRIVAQPGATTEVFGFMVTALGQHTLQVSAFNFDAVGAIVEGAKSSAVSFEVVTPTSPSTAPASNVRVIKP